MTKVKGRKFKAKPVKPLPLGGDHGTGTQAAMVGTVLEPIKGSPNGMGRRRRGEAIDAMDLTVRQQQAAKAVRNAYCATESLSSGGPLKEWVQSSPKPDAAVDRQVEVNSKFAHVMNGVARVDRPVIEHVCFHNQPLRTFYKHTRQNARFKQALDRLADHMRY